MGVKQKEAQRAGRTVFTRTVVDPPVEPKFGKIRVPLHALTWAADNRKLGGRLEKGRWKGCPIFALTLEERATCPRTCQQWKTCYGDNLHMARRLAAGPALEAAVEADVVVLGAVFPEGFVVRLHVLGDFYSVPYVRHWARLLRENPALRVYGYTHRAHSTPIGRAVAALVTEFPERAAMMRSEPTVPGDPLPAAWVVPSDAKEGIQGSVLCPQETGRTKSCGTCGLCMNGFTNVSFLDHSWAVVNARTWEKRRLAVVEG